MNKALEKPVKPAFFTHELREGHVYQSKLFGGRNWDVLKSSIWIEDEGKRHAYGDFTVAEYIGQEEEVPSLSRRGRYDAYCVTRQKILMKPNF
jgi:hypothetical protein